MGTPVGLSGTFCTGRSVPWLQTARKSRVQKVWRQNSMVWRQKKQPLDLIQSVTLEHCLQQHSSHSLHFPAGGEGLQPNWDGRWNEKQEESADRF